MLALPESAGARIDGEPLHVAVAVAPDLRARAKAAHEGVVRRDAAVQVQPHQLALQHRQVLRQRFLVALALADEHVAAALAVHGVEGDARAEMVGAFQLGQLPVDHPQVGQPRIAQGGGGHGGAGGAAVARFGVAQPDPSRLSKIRGQHHIQQTSLPVSPNLRNAGYRVRKAFPG